ncbi:hypothetical protein CAPI_09130 [Corynebacterium capitovis DSM 44611]|uniref:universal stress protein n=1 Tax=Corynebacterium capitovis TaxID=131081 RepID=UPI000369D821|nr:universal stress protein [Corynebacterium capitovis]WKD58349.1 hypothetical protein CAPI_09130 [Corynebacterium capitovis DSM 44611]
MTLNSTLPIAVLSESRPLRLHIGWDRKHAEPFKLAAWLGRSVPVSVSVSAVAKPTLAKRLPGERRSTWLSAAGDELASEVSQLVDGLLAPHQRHTTFTHLVEAQRATAGLVDTVTGLGADMIILGPGTGSTKLGETSPKDLPARLAASVAVETILSETLTPLAFVPRGVELSTAGITRLNCVFASSGRPHFSPMVPRAAALAGRIGVPLRLIAINPRAALKPNLQAPAHERAADDWYECSLASLDLARDLAVSAAGGTPGGEGFEVEVGLASGKGWRKAVDSIPWCGGDLVFTAAGREPTRRRGVFDPRVRELVRHSRAPVIVCPLV